VPAGPGVAAGQGAAAGSGTADNTEATWLQPGAD
jgi:hypothetical protein